jgi:hypothetical protein
MISRQEWDQLSDDQKFDHLFRHIQWTDHAIHVCSTAIDNLREEIRQQLGKTPPTPLASVPA